MTTRRATGARFFCLCMSPAVDATVKLPRAPKGEGEIFKDVADEENVGGKAVNVARFLALRGAAVACGGILGEDNAAPFERELAAYGVKDAFLRVTGATRRNEMVTWPGGAFKMNRAAFPHLEGSFDPMVAVEVMVCEAQSSAGGNPVAVISGSLPPSISKDFYARAVARFKSLGWAAALDASGEAMKLALDSLPDIVKPNAEECEALVGFVPKTPGDFARATALLREKAAHVVISDGAAGAWFDGEFVAAPKVNVVDTTAAGDTLLAEYCWRMYGGETPGDAARWAVAAGSAACTMPGGAPPSLEIVSQLAQP